MLAYYPKNDPTARITWYGTNSTMIRFEILDEEDGWREINVKTLGEFPTDVGELYQTMRNFHEEQP
jgi:hypothetical protein